MDFNFLCTGIMSPCSLEIQIKIWSGLITHFSNGSLDMTIAVLWHAAGQHWHRHCKNLKFALRNFLSKNRTFLANTLQYSFLNLFIQRQNLFLQLFIPLNFLPPNSTKLTSKTYMVESFKKTGFPERFICWIKQLFRREPVSACFCWKELYNRRIAGVLKLCSLQAYSLL